MTTRRVPEKHREALAAAIAADKDDKEIAGILGVQESAARTYRRNMQLNDAQIPINKPGAHPQPQAVSKKSNATNHRAAPIEDDYARAMAQHLNGSVGEARSPKGASGRVFGERRLRYYPDTEKKPERPNFSEEEFFERLRAIPGLRLRAG